MNDNVHPVFRDYINSVFKPLPSKPDCTCGMTGKQVPPEDMGGCNNASGCGECVHNEDLE
jgi:hypothetical protein